MTARCDFCYAQARMQSRFGQRADEQVWLRLHNVLDLASYLQVAQQTPLRPWVLGVGASHNSHEIELLEALISNERENITGKLINKIKLSKEDELDYRWLN